MTVPTDLPHDAVDRLIERGAAAHPGIGRAAALHDFIAERAAAALAARDPDARAGDLYVAAACAAGDPAAIAHVDAGLPAIVRPSLARLGLPASDDDEIVQRVRVALLASDREGARGIAGYSGRGELRAYIRAVAVKLALKRLERETGPSVDNDALELVADPQDSPSLRLLKERCRGDLRAAFATAFGDLSARERTLLRQHYLDGLSIDVLGPLHRVHRATCARWIEAARNKVLRGVRRHLQAVLDLGAADLDSAIELVRSQLDLSLSRHLASQPGLDART